MKEKAMHNISNISDYLAFLKEGLGNDVNHDYFFRGHSNALWKILPSIYREIDGFSFINNEGKIFREILLRAPKEFINELSAIEKLVKMQHYGIPTRLLDITSNPLIGLYFACSEKKEMNSNGEVIAFQIPKEKIKFNDSDTVSMLANLAKMRDSVDIDYSFLNPEPINVNYISKEDAKSLHIERFNRSVFAGYLLHEIKSEKPQFRNLMDPFDFNQIIPIKVKQSSERIVRQNGAFLLFGIKNGKKILPADIIDSSDHKRNKLIKITHIKIDADAKNSILADLAKLGIDESTIFPEIEHQASLVKNIYGYKI